MKEIMEGEIYVWQYCVEIEGYSVSLVLSAVSLNFRSSFLSPQGLSSAFTGTFPLLSSLSFTSSLNSVPSTTSLPSLSCCFIPKSF